MKNLLHIFAVLCISFSLKAQSRLAETSIVHSERMLALVIGNNDYESISPLKNPPNDADDMAAALKKLGFSVTVVKNTDYRKTNTTFENFINSLREGDIAFFYYSGHGIGYNGKNYLVPVDFTTTCLEQLDEYAVSFNKLITGAELRRPKNLFVVLDACRSIGKLRECRATTNSKETLGNGLTRPTNNPKGSIIVYATDEGYTAEDNQKERNGLFTGELLKHLTTPNIGFRSILDLTANDVEEKSQKIGKPQSPARYDKLGGDFMFLVSKIDNSDAQNELVRLKEENERLKNSTVSPTTKKIMDLPFAEMAYIEGGTFTMGDTRNEGMDNEKPAHNVTVSGFWMGKYEITQKQWENIMGNNPSYFKGCEDCPVENVSWNEVQEFLKKLNTQTGGNYRLPTEAEWEYAAGGGEGNRSRFGNGKELAAPMEINFDGSEFSKRNVSQESKFGSKTIPVGSFSPNSLGLYDMSGNVWEYCSDRYSSYKKRNSVNPSGAFTGADSVVRGGGWNAGPLYNRVTYRSASMRDFRYSFTGFRVVSF